MGKAEGAPKVREGDLTVFYMLSLFPFETGSCYIVLAGLKCVIICCITQGDLKLMNVFLFLPPMCWDGGHRSPHLAFYTLR